MLYLHSNNLNAFLKYYLSHTFSAGAKIGSEVG